MYREATTPPRPRHAGHPLKNLEHIHSLSDGVVLRTKLVAALRFISRLASAQASRSSFF